MQSQRQWVSRGIKSAFWRTGAAAVMLALMALAGQAQTFRGAINGTVTDPSGAVIPNAQVKATETATGIDHNTVTTSDGQFSFQDIQLGFYKVTVTAPGFPPFTVDKVEVVAGTIYTLPIKLSMQQQSTTVEVSAAALTLDTTTQTQSTTISSDIVQDVPSEWPGLHADDRHCSGLLGILGRRLWLAEWHTSQSNELADRRCGQQ